MTNDTLSYLKDLKDLTIPAARISNEGLAKIAHLKSIKRLSLQGCKDITDEGLVHLTHCWRLEYVFLDSTPVTDKGLKHLVQLSKLEALSLKDTAVSNGGALLLRLQRPNCKVTR